MNLSMIVGIIGVMGNHLIYALPLPANHAITTKLTDTIFILNYFECVYFDTK